MCAGLRFQAEAEVPSVGHDFWDAAAHALHKTGICMKPNMDGWFLGTT